jgi:hypothetical protein
VDLCDRDITPAASQFALQGGKLVLFVNGETTAQSFGIGGIKGGGIVVLGGVNSVCAPASYVLFVCVTVPQPPPSQNPDCVPSDLISVAILLENVTGPHADAYCFHTETAVLPPPDTGVRLSTLLLSTT